jgi:hypothetical protein
MPFLFFLACAVLLVCVLDRLWLRHVDGVARGPLFDPDGTLDVIARMAELCHGDRVQVDLLIARQRQLHPELTHGDAVRSAMQQLMAPQASSRRFSD